MPSEYLSIADSGDGVLIGSIFKPGPDFMQYCMKAQLLNQACPVLVNLKPNSVTLSGSKLVGDQLRTS